MKYVVLVAVLLLGWKDIPAQGIEFFEGTWVEALAEAEAKEKIIFVDAYAEWCGPCKRMARNVFTNSEVGDFFNENFINLKLDMEKGEGLNFRKTYPVQAFPTLFFIDFTGEVVQKVRGAQNVEPLIQLGKKALQNIDRSEEYAAAYEAGDRDPKLVYNYVKSLNQAGKPSLAVANEYLRTQDDLTTEENLKFIHIAAAEADSRIFQLLIDHRAAIETVVGAQAVQEQIEAACRATLAKAIEFESEDLLTEAKMKMRKHHPARADVFELQAEMDFCAAMGDAKKYVKNCATYAKKQAKNDPQELHQLAKSMIEQFPTDTKAMTEAERIAGDAAEQSDDYRYYLTYANILAKNGKTEAAKSAARRSLTLAGDKDPMAKRAIEHFLQQLEG